MDITGRAEEAVLKALADGAKSRNQIVKGTERPNGVHRSVWHAAVTATLDRLEEEGTVTIREEPRPPIQRYSLDAAEDRAREEFISRWTSSEEAKTHNHTQEET